MTIDTSYFEGELSMGQITSPAVIASVNLFIQKYEDDLLTRLLGYELYRDYKAGIVESVPAQKWIDIRDGKEYTNSGGQLTKWKGLRFSNGYTPITTYFIAPITFTIGDGGANTPLNGANVYSNTALAGLTNIDLAVFRDGTLKFAGTDYTVDSAGGITLLGLDVFVTGEDFQIFTTVPQTVSAPGAGTLKQSPIANYVYYQYLKDNISFTMGAGEVTPKSNSSDKVNPFPKMVRAWNEMVQWNWQLVEFLQEYDDIYPEFENSEVLGYWPYEMDEVLRLKNRMGI